MLTASPGPDPELSFTYDLANRLLTANKAGSGDASFGTYTLNYDRAGRLYQEETPDSKLITASLDGNGNITAVTYSDEVSVVTSSFDALDRLVSVTGIGGGVSLGYDSASRRIAQYNGNGTAQGYWWDITDNLLAMTLGGLVPNTSLGIGKRVDFTYAVTNIAQQSGKQSSNAGFLWQPTTMETITYGTANNLNQYPSVNEVDYSYDNNGCLTSDGVNSYEYDSQSNLISVNTTINFSYDAFGRLTQKETTAGTVRYINFGLLRMEELTSSGEVTTRYVYGAGIDECLYVADVSTGAVTYLHLDETGSNILSTGAPSEGIVEQNVYDSWGNLASGSLENISIGFTGQFYQPEVGLYWYKSRYYSPALGRFLQPDTIGYSGGLNLYEYCGSDPINSKDPMGTQAEVDVGSAGATTVQLPYSGDGDLPSTSSGWGTGTQPYSTYNYFWSSSGSGTNASAGKGSSSSSSNSSANSPAGGLTPGQILVLEEYAQAYDNFLAQQAARRASVAKNKSESVPIGNNLALRLKLSLQAGDVAQNISDFAAGFGDAASLGLTPLIRQLTGANAYVRFTSPSYLGGFASGFLTTFFLHKTGYETGHEFQFGRNVRIAPWGNRTGHNLGELPHYHRRGPIGPNGQTAPGQGIGRHRPWQTSPVDSSFWARF